MANRNTPRSKIDAGPLIDVTVVGGAGHAGLPLALAFAGEGLRVLIYDINAEALDMLRHGRLPAVEIGAEPLLERGLAVGNRATGLYGLYGNCLCLICEAMIGGFSERTVRRGYCFTWARTKCLGYLLVKLLLKFCGQGVEVVPRYCVKVSSILSACER